LRLLRSSAFHSRERRSSRNNAPVPDKKLNALVVLVKEFVRDRGHAKDETIQNFIAAGYKKEQVMELLLGIALKSISNYLNHISPRLSIWHSPPRVITDFLPEYG
jgi:hypothetical protein